MKILIYVFTIAVLATPLTANAKNSFRLSSGKIISVGQSIAEVYSLAGSPISRNVEKQAVATNSTSDPTKREILIYQLGGSFDNKFTVTITVENNKVISIYSKQLNRL